MLRLHLALQRSTCPVNAHPLREIVPRGTYLPQTRVLRAGHTPTREKEANQAQRPPLRQAQAVLRPESAIRAQVLRLRILAPESHLQRRHTYHLEVRLAAQALEEALRRVTLQKDRPLRASP